MSANFRPVLEGYSGQGTFRFWCQKVLPLVYDDSLSYYELLNKVVDYLNHAIEDIGVMENNVQAIADSYGELEDWVNEEFYTLKSFVENYFNNLDVQEEINHKLDEMASNGSLSALLAPFIPDLVTDWLNEHITPTSPIIDSSLSISGAAADAKTTGDKITDLRNDIQYRAVTTIDIGLFEKGSLDHGADDTYMANSRIRTPILLAINEITISVLSSNPEARILVDYISSDGSYKSGSGWITNKITISRGTIFRLLLNGYWGTSPETVLTREEIIAKYSIVSQDTNININIDSCVKLLKSDYKHGNLVTTGTGEDDYNSEYRIINIAIRKSIDDLVVTATDAKFYAYYYDDEGVYTGESGWISSESLIIPANTPYRLCLTIDDTTAHTISEILSHFTIEKTSSNIIEVINADKIETLFEHGNIRYDGSNDGWNKDARARNINILTCSKDLHIKYVSGVYIIATYDTNGNFVELTDWLINDHIIQAGTPFRVLVTPAPSLSTPTSITEILAGIEMKVINTYSYGLNPNIIYQCRAVDDTAYPPESKWYVKAAAQNQYDRVRFTVRRTTDGYWFNCHDNNINNLARNPDGTEISETVSASGKTLAQLNAYDWGIKYGSKYAGFGVPLLEDGLKYASLYNLGVTFHFADPSDQTQANVTELLEMLDKYGLTDNLIVISANGRYASVFNYFKNHNPRISFYAGAEEEWWEVSSNYANLKALQTNYNKIYVQLYPWGTPSTDEFITLAKENNFDLYDSITMSKADLLNMNMFNKGYSIREVNNVYMVKDTVRTWADSLIE